jgi:hypothetical protein
MPPSDVRCVLVKIHGIGNQKKDWSKRFDAMLKQHIDTLPTDKQARFVNESVYWADVSTVPGLGAPAGVAGGPAAAGGAPAAAQVSQFQQYVLLQQSYMSYLEGGGATAPGGAPAAFGLPNPAKIIAKLKDVTVKAADTANDVANYISNNGVRIQMQHRLSDKLFEVRATFPNATVILGSHSQGTIVAYDVLRLMGGAFPKLTTWVTMGSPLGWYFSLRWGEEQLSLPPALTWLNYFDDEDKVGKDVKKLIDWPKPVPTDIDVNNTGVPLDAHDHWHNPAVVQRYFDLISPLL